MRYEMLEFIKQYDSTSYIQDFKFSLITEIEELENILKTLNGKEPLEFMSGVDYNTFQPMTLFAIPEEGVSFSLWKKYAVHLKPTTDVNQ